MFLSQLKSCLPYLRVYRREVLIGIAALLVTDLVGLVIPWLLKEFVDLLPQKPAEPRLRQFAGLLFLAATVQAVSRFGWRKFLFGPSRKIEVDLQNRLFGHILNLDKSWFLKQKIGDLMSRGTNDLRAVRDFVGLGLLIFIDSLVVIAACITLMLVIHPRLTLMAFLPLPLISILFFKFVKAIGERHEAVQEHLARITARVQENLAGIRVLHAFVQEENEKRKFDQLNKEYIRKNLKVAKLFGLFTPSLVFTLGVAALISLWIGGKAVIQGEMTLGSFVAFNGYLMMLSWPMMGVGYVFNLTQKGLAAMRRIQRVFSAEPSVKDLAAPQPSWRIEGEVRFQSVSFNYPGTRTPILRELDLLIEKGTRLGVVGKVGAGKSTLAQLIPRLFDASSGTIRIDGKPVRDLPLALLRENIGYVDQDPFLFSTSVRGNITLGREGASPKEIESVVACVNLVSDLARFPAGLDTVVGERGVALSGGQKQRIALARALLRKPKILILDDAFSSLDAETEEIILGNIRKFALGVTTVLITHRLSAVRDADQIVVLDQGQIVERGGHVELLKNGGRYAQLYQNQILAREMEITLK